MSLEQKSRICSQRAMTRQAFGILHGVTEMFGAESAAHISVHEDYEAWRDKVAEFEKWVFGESPIA